ncbi:hypothetical protein [Desulfogranum mediterraneum]|uniref:hypothetical protein n=1 Tax=Desulfogranum mediterraneum TaxID=160661 RepID=UPI00129484D2|nr:hypothetical protein [Desulfogranum mediterraneum]
MMNRTQKNDYGIVIFKEGTPPGERRKAMFFFTVLSLIILGQACYWLVANSVEPIVLGMPFGMFTVVILIVLEFVALAAMYLLEPKEAPQTGEQR